MSSKSPRESTDAAHQNAGEIAPAVQVQLPDGTSLHFGRRDFMRVSAVATAAAGLAGTTTGCSPPQENILPRTLRPEEARPGLALNYATTCFACPAGCGVVAKAREGRVVKLEGNPQHPVNRAALCARGQAMVLDLYDPDRARASLAVARGKSAPLTLAPESLDDTIVQALKKANGGKPRVALLTGAVSGGAARALVQEFLQLFASSRWVEWEPLGVLAETVESGQERCYGTRLVPQYRLDRANVIVAFGAEFLDTWLSPVQLSRYFLCPPSWISRSSRSISDGTGGRV